jgi:hypothetical protein
MLPAMILGSARSIRERFWAAGGLAALALAAGAGAASAQDVAAAGQTPRFVVVEDFTRFT